MPTGPPIARLELADVVEAVVAGRQVVEPRDAAEPDVVEHLRELAERAREVVVLEAHPQRARAPGRSRRAAARRPARTPRATTRARRGGSRGRTRRGGRTSAPRYRRRSRPPARRARAAAATTSATAANHARTCARNAALAYDGIGHARGGVGIHAGVPRAVRAWHAGSASTQSGIPKLVSSALTCGPGRSTTASPAASAMSRKPARSLVAAPVELAGRRLVDAPRHVGLDDREADVVHRAQARRPARAGDAPVVHRAGVERQLALADRDPGRRRSATASLADPAVGGHEVAARATAQAAVVQRHRLARRLRVLRVPRQQQRHAAAARRRGRIGCGSGAASRRAASTASSDACCASSQHVRSCGGGSRSWPLSAGASHGAIHT